MKFKAVVIGASSGGMNALRTILPALHADFGMPVIIVQHIGITSENYWIEMLNDLCPLNVKEADEKEKIEKGKIYLAPPNYHLLVERNETFSLSIDHRVNFARPSVDVLFETAAEAYREKLIGIVLTGANNDGAAGLQKIKSCGGMAVVQDPATAESPFMPASAIKKSQVDHILSLEKIIDLLIKTDKQS